MWQQWSWWWFEGMVSELDHGTGKLTPTHTHTDASIVNTLTHTGHTHVITYSSEREPQRITVTHLHQVPLVACFCATSEHAVRTCQHNYNLLGVCAFVLCVWVSLSRGICTVCCYPLSMVAFTDHLCVTPQHSSFMTVISPHGKSLLNSALSVLYTKDAIISSVIHAPRQNADIIFTCISGNSNECLSRRANAYGLA